MPAARDRASEAGDGDENQDGQRKGKKDEIQDGHIIHRWVEVSCLIERPKIRSKSGID